MILNKYNRTYWKFFNYFMKFVGWWFLVLGSIIVVMNTMALFMTPSPFEENSELHTSTFLRVMYVAMPFIGAVIGWLLIKAKPYNLSSSTEPFKPREEYEVAKQPWE